MPGASFHALLMQNTARLDQLCHLFAFTGQVKKKKKKKKKKEYYLSLTKRDDQLCMQIVHQMQTACF